MMNKIISIILFCLSLLQLKAQTNPTQDLMNLLMQDEFFKARDYYQTNKEQIAEGGELFYKYRMSYLSNKPDSAAIYLENFITDYTKAVPADSKIIFVNLLVSLYTEMKDYSKLVDTYDMIEQLLKQAPFDGEEYTEWKKEQFALLSQFKSDAQKNSISIPKMQVIRDAEGNQKIKLKKDPAISVPTAIAEFNDVPLTAIFDTGSDIPVIVKKKYAEKCRFKEIPSPQDSFPLNGALVKANTALIDSIRVGSFIFKNIVALVIQDDLSSLFPDSTSLSKEEKKDYNSAAELFDAIIGLPVLKSLGSIQFDFEKEEMILNSQSEVANTKKDANIFISGNQLFMRLSVNDRDFIGFVDTGNEFTCVELSSAFYTSNQDYITLSSQEKQIGIASLATITKNASYKTITNPIVKYDGKTISLEKDDDCVVKLDSPDPLHHRDGGIGLLLFKRIGSKVNLDFVNMSIGTAE